MGTHGPIEEEFRQQMNDLARSLDRYFNAGADPKKLGFCLLVFPFGDKPDGRINYISNAQRENVLLALEELVARWKGTHPEEQEPGR